MAQTRTLQKVGNDGVVEVFTDDAGKVVRGQVYTKAQLQQMITNSIATTAKYTEMVAKCDE